MYVPAGTAVEERQVEYDYPPGDLLAGVDFDGELRGELRLKYDVSLPLPEFADQEPIAIEHPRARELREVWSEVRSDRVLYRWSRLQIGGYAQDGEGLGGPRREMRACHKGGGG